MPRGMETVFALHWNGINQGHWAKVSIAIPQRPCDMNVIDQISHDAFWFYRQQIGRCS